MLIDPRLASLHIILLPPWLVQSSGSYSSMHEHPRKLKSTVFRCNENGDAFSNFRNLEALGDVIWC